MPDLVQQLRDIHVPPEPSWWPLAAGWWIIVALLCCLVLAVLLWRWWNRRHFVRWQWEQWEHVKSTQRGSLANSWLKQAAMLAVERSDVARLHGADWVQFLQQQGVDVPAAIAVWLEKGYLYHQEPPDETYEWLVQAVAVLSKNRVLMP